MGLIRGLNSILGSISSNGRFKILVADCCNGMVAGWFTGNTGAGTC